MNTLNIKQISLTFGIMGVLLFLSSYGYILLFDGLEIHKQLLLEEFHWHKVGWPLTIYQILIGVIHSFFYGLMFGGVLGYIFNILGSTTK